MRKYFFIFVSFLYRRVLKPILFLQDASAIHIRAIELGNFLSKIPIAKSLFSFLFRPKYPILSRNLFGLNFKTPVGLAAGFDYEGRLTQILPAIGFGFGTIGTLTNSPYAGNPPPILGRLPRSQALMVNKGFKNLGVTTTLNGMRNLKFEYPVGVSIGKTNTPEHKTQEDGIRDVVRAFKKAESFEIPFAYYELNISCPNLFGNIEFYQPEHLEDLLSAIEKLKIRRMVFLKMPISKTDEEIKSIMEVVIRHPFIRAVVIGNLQRDRNNPALLPEEVGKFSKGNFSGLPCRERSDELIDLVYRNYGSRIKIIGCGGIFSAKDAYRKIKLGASLVQLITGMIFEGPQLIAQINLGLAEMLKRDGYKSITEAVGKCR